MGLSAGAAAGGLVPRAEPQPPHCTEETDLEPAGRLLPYQIKICDWQLQIDPAFFPIPVPGQRSLSHLNRPFFFFFLPLQLCLPYKEGQHYQVESACYLPLSFNK